MKPRLIFSLLFLLVWKGTVAQSNEWTLVKDEDHIRIYSRKTEGQRALNELKVLTDVKGSLSSIVTILSEKANYPQWVYGCGSAEILEKVSELETYHYQTTEMPWPVQNRDLIIHTIVRQDPETKVVSIDCAGAPEYLPVLKSHIRIRSYHAFWILTPKPGGLVEINYAVNFDPAGSLPDWVVNMVSAEGPMKTVKNLRTRLADYQHIKPNSIVKD